jgi:hypothetical protein
MDDGVVIVELVAAVRLSVNTSIEYTSDAL